MIRGCSLITCTCVVQDYRHRFSLHWSKMASANASDSLAQTSASTIVLVESQKTFNTILVLEFGSQYTHLITRRLRELNIYCEMLPCTQKLEELSWKPEGIYHLSWRPILRFFQHCAFCRHSTLKSTIWEFSSTLKYPTRHSERKYFRDFSVTAPLSVIGR